MNDFKTNEDNICTMLNHSQPVKELAIHAILDYAKMVVAAPDHTYKNSFVNVYTWKGCANQWVKVLEGIEDSDVIKTVIHNLNFSDYGVMIQAFAISAICEYCRVLASGENEEDDEALTESLEIDVATFVEFKESSKHIIKILNTAGYDIHR